MKRGFIISFAVLLGLGGIAQAAIRPKERAIAFDALAIFDPSPLWSEAEKLFPVQGAELAAEWRSRLFEYQWLRAAGGRYADFENVAADALTYAAKKRNITLSSDQHKALLAQLFHLKPYPDAKSAIQDLRSAGFRLAILSNMTPAMLNAGIKNSGLEGLFDEVISTDRVHRYKPDPLAYQLGVDVLNLKREEILFVAFAGWDLAGARWFGYPTFWVNRLQMPAEELDAPPQNSGKTLMDLVRFVHR